MEVHAPWHGMARWTVASVLPVADAPAPMPLLNRPRHGTRQAMHIPLRIVTAVQAA